jgi:hypothetical protein
MVINCGVVIVWVGSAVTVAAVTVAVAVAVTGAAADEEDALPEGRSRPKLPIVY